jgi:hypothetical protein
MIINKFSKLLNAQEYTESCEGEHDFLASEAHLD